MDRLKMAVLKLRQVEAVRRLQITIRQKRDICTNQDTGEEAGQINHKAHRRMHHKICQKICHRTHRQIQRKTVTAQIQIQPV